MPGATWGDATSAATYGAFSPSVLQASVFLGQRDPLCILPCQGITCLHLLCPDLSKIREVFLRRDPQFWVDDPITYHLRTKHPHLSQLNPVLPKQDWSQGEGCSQLLEAGAGAQPGSKPPVLLLESWFPPTSSLGLQVDHLL